MITVFPDEKSNVTSASTDAHISSYIASYIPGLWSLNSSASEGITQGNIVLVNPTGTSLGNLSLAMQVDGSEIVHPALRLWDSNYVLNPPNTLLQSELLFADTENNSTPITTISIEPNQKETLSLVFPSQEAFQFSNHSILIYVTQNNFGDIINGQPLKVPQTQAYLQIVNYSAIESDQGTYQQYYDNASKSQKVTVAYNANFYQRYHNITKEDYYADNFGILHYMGVLDYSYFNVTVFNNNTFPVNSVALQGQIPSRGTNTYTLGGALIDYVMQPGETYLFPIKQAEHPIYSYMTGYVTNNSQPVSPTPNPTVPEFPILAILPLFIAMSLMVNKFLRRKT